MFKKIVLLFFLTLVIIIVFSFSIIGSLKPMEPQGKELLSENLQSNSHSPKISVAFVDKAECEAGRVLRIRVTSIPKESILAVSLIPEIDGIDAGANLAKPIPPAGYRELPGLPVVHKVKPPDYSWDICYPSFVFDRNTYLPPDSRRITGWIVRVYIVDSIAARPLAGGRNIGKLQILTLGDLPDGLSLLGTEMEKEKFSLANFKVIAIPQSNSGVFFYVNEEALIIWIKKKFDADISE